MHDILNFLEMRTDYVGELDSQDNKTDVRDALSKSEDGEKEGKERRKKSI